MVVMVPWIAVTWTRRGMRLYCSEEIQGLRRLCGCYTYSGCHGGRTGGVGGDEQSVDLLWRVKKKHWRQGAD